MTKKIGVTFISLVAFANSAAFAMPSGSVSQLEPTKNKSYKMQLLQDIKLDRLIDSENSFYANSADYIVDGNIMTSDEYYLNYGEVSHCQISVFNFAKNKTVLAKASKVETLIGSTIETKDRNWKDGAYNWSSLQGMEADSSAYIASVTCSYEGSIRAMLKPQMSIEVMQKMLKGVVEISEVK